MPNITAIIVIKNNPPTALQSIASIDNFVSEIIIGDLEMDDSLKKELIKNKKVKIIPVPHNIPYADLIKEDLKKQASSAYILYLDPDEIFPESIRDSILKNIPSYDFFHFPRKNIIFGKWIAHSRWWPDYQLRFFKKDSVIWPKKIHPIPTPQGRGFKFEAVEENAILHYNYEDLDHFMEKAVRYAKSEAKTYLENDLEITLPETIKKSLSEFMSRFFAHEGYKDGLHGFALSILQMFYCFLVFFYYWEQKKYFEIDSQTLIQESNYLFKQGYKESYYWTYLQEKRSFLKRIKNKFINLFVR